MWIKCKHTHAILTHFGAFKNTVMISVLCRDCDKHWCGHREQVVPAWAADVVHDHLMALKLLGEMHAI